MKAPNYSAKYTTVQSPNVVCAYFTSKQLLHLASTEQYSTLF